MKSSLHAAVASAFLLISISSVSVLADVTITYRFSEPSVETAEGGFSRIVFPATMQAGKAGEPSFPFKGAAVLLLPGEAVASARIERRGWKIIAGDVRLYPYQPPFPGSEAAAEGNGGHFLYKQDVYAQNRLIQPPDSELKTRYLCGHPIATGSFSPVGYNPATGEAGYWSEIEVAIETAASEDAAAAANFLRNDVSTLSRLSALVDNPAALPDAETALSPEDAYEYLIITYRYYEEALEPLKDFYNRRGVRTEIKTVEDIGFEYTGIDVAAEIRQAISAAYIEAGITCVLLAGDSDASQVNLPHRGLYCTVLSGVLYTDSNIPADIYFASLDGNWNADGDHYWGEPGEEDFYSEVAVGRITFDSEAEVAAIINKITMYQESPVIDQCDNAVLLGELLWNDPLTYGGNEMDQLIGTWPTHGFTTTCIPCTHDLLLYYDRDLGSWDKSVVWTEFNSGTHLVCHAGHTNYSYLMRMVIGDINTTNFTNDGQTANFPVVNSFGCIAGGFDYNDCIAEEMISLATCASAFVGNSRYGWFTEGTTNGPSHHFQREFFDAIFSEGITKIGEAHVRSKDETVPFVDLPDEYEPGAHRWCFYCLNVLGDPAMDIWTGQPVPIIALHEPGIDSEATGFTVETDAPGSTGALYEGGVCYGAGTAGPDGIISISLNVAIPNNTDLLELTVVAHDRLVYRSDISITGYTGDGDHPPRLALLQNSPNPFNPSTTIRFTLGCEGYVDLRTYDAAGREIDILAARTMEAGGHEIRWNAAGLSSGVYFYVLRAEGRIKSRKAVLLR